MDCIVLVKQVPDVSNIPEDAWDREKGTLRRAMLDSVLNPLDLHALTFAGRLAGSDPGGRIVFLTMGPPQAREVLVDCLSRLPGEAVLLTDHAFAGADTGATAYSLACAIRRIEHDLLGGSRDYAIVSGMQSVDGDTAQVPPQIAEELGIEHIAYAKGLETEPAIRVRRIGPEGIEDVSPRRLPVLVTVTACTDPLYRSLEASRQARQGSIHEWSAASVGADPARIGLKGSWTQVYRLFSPSEDRAKSCEIIHDAAELVARIRARYGQAAPGAPIDADESYRLDGREPTYRGELWVYAEHEGDGVRSVTLELLGKARHLAESLGEQVGAVLPCDEAGDRPEQLIAAGADVVYVLEHPLLGTFLPIPFKDAVAALVTERMPQVLLFGATPLGRELAPRIAYACRSGLTADCTRLEIGDFSKGTTNLVGILKQTRPALGGNVMATIMTKDSPTQMATVRPGVFKVPVPDPARAGTVVRVPVDLDARSVGLDVSPVESFATRVSIRDAEIVVAGGHGFRSRADFETYLQPLALGLGRLLGASTRVAASRMAVEDGFTTHDFQVGQTGQTVQPRLYVAIGISGAVQHITGMQGSEIVVAVNKDPKARIFNYADFGLVGDIETVVPELVRATEGGAASTRSTS
ncbi:MAG: FAD-binding protein [Chloroflexi bacterium]|jgi:electron transfer flavoprotein alpha subunit|nr:FAD-binding protein [Chloroflexota bacterium]